jgi:hypothetical protein
MKTDTINGTVRAVTAMGRNARRLADQLAHHKVGTDAPRHAAMHRVETALRDFGNVIRDGEAALTPSARIAIAELASG